MKKYRAHALVVLGIGTRLTLTSLLLAGNQQLNACLCAHEGFKGFCQDQEGIGIIFANLLRNGGTKLIYDINGRDFFVRHGF